MNRRAGAGPESPEPAGSPGRTRARGTGPGAFVTAAFIGPGTIVTCTAAGAGFGYALLWAILFSVIATIILQEMAGRASLAAGAPLARQIAARFATPAAKWAAAGLLMAAIAFGCAAYQSGNLSGGGAGLEILVPALRGPNLPPAAGMLGLAAGLLLFFSGYSWLERVLKLMVFVMSICFAAAAILTGPRIPGIVAGLFVPALPAGSAATALGLIGTTVVPYNLFLYSRAVLERFDGPADLPAMRRDLYAYVVLGGAVSAFITITAAAVLHGRISDPALADMPLLLEPVLGRWASVLFGAGLFAAGFSSALTAPLAGAYVVAGVFNTSAARTGRLYRASWLSILAAGVFFAVKPDLRPEHVIKIAQVANGLLLPLVAVFLVIAMNAAALGPHRNGALRNGAAVIIILVAAILGMRLVAGAFGGA